MKTTKKLWCQALALIGATLILLNSCEKGQGDGNNGQLVVDADGNVYATVIIGNQEWIVENLRTTRYSDGSSIPTGHTNEQWGSLSTGAYAIYPHSQIDGLNSDAEVLEAYGALYNWYAIDDERGICPTGWHVPTDSDWNQLILYIDPDNYWGYESLIAGSKLKSLRTIPDAQPRWDSPPSWVCPNTVATDEYDFSALPGGYRNTNGYFLNVSRGGFWLSSTESDASSAWLRAMGCGHEIVIRFDYYKSSGFSVRCIRDN